MRMIKQQIQLVRVFVVGSQSIGPVSWTKASAFSNIDSASQSHFWIFKILLPTLQRSITNRYNFAYNSCLLLQTSSIVGCMTAILDLHMHERNKISMLWGHQGLHDLCKLFTQYTHNTKIPCFGSPQVYMTSISDYNYYNKEKEKK